MSNIGHNTMDGQELRRRAVEIAGKVRMLGGLKVQERRIKDELKGLYQLAGSAGYDTKILKGVVGEMLMDPDQLEMHLDDEKERGEMVERYRHALGLLEDGGPDTTLAADIRAKLVESGWEQDEDGTWFQAKRPGQEAAASRLDERAEQAGAAPRKGKLRGTVVPLPERTSEEA